MNDALVGALGRAIQERREAKYWTRYRLAQKAEMSAPYLTDIESGNISRPGVLVIARVATELGTTPDELLREAGILSSRRTPAVAPDLAAMYADLDVYARHALVENARTLCELQERYAARLASEESEESEESGLEVESETDESLAAHREPLPPGGDTPT